MSSVLLLLQNNCPQSTQNVLVIFAMADFREQQSAAMKFRISSWKKLAQKLKCLSSSLISKEKKCQLMTNLTLVRDKISKKWEESPINSLFHRVRQLSRRSSWKFKQDCTPVFDRKGLICGTDWFFHHNNTPAHIALRVPIFDKKRHDYYAPPPYSPDLASCDLFLFPWLNRDFSEVKTKMTEASHKAN